MTKRKPKRDASGHFLPAKNGKKTGSPARRPEPSSRPDAPPSMELIDFAYKALHQPVMRTPPIFGDSDPDRPACFGGCYELSSACSACRWYNPCRRASG